ncbi:MAG: DUF4760 domain-containing protein [Flavobacterium sp.]|nr:DUF4760 domain-containing protein [Flavobacterium sp.]
MEDLEKSLTKLIFNKLFSLRIAFVVIWISTTLIAALYLKYVKNETIKDVLPLVTCSIIIMTLFYHVINYEHNLRKFNHDIKIARETLSFNTATEWHKPTMIEHMKNFAQKIENFQNLVDQSNGKEFSLELDKLENEELKTSIVCMLNYFESISLGVKQGITDEDFINGFFKTVFTNYYYKLNFFIEYRRKQRQNQKIWANYTHITQKWLSCD